MLQVLSVTKRYQNRQVLRDVSLTLARGEILGLVGPNGAGKSTLLSLLAGVVPPSGGEILVNGRSIHRNPAQVAGLIGYVPQEIALYNSLTVRDNLTFWARLFRLPRRETGARVAALAGVVGLLPHLDVQVEKLSGGMKRKLHIAVALLPDPPVLVMDEPTAGIDIQSCREILTFIKERSRDGKAVIYATHSYEEIQRLCDRVCLLHQGELRFVGTLDEARQAAATKAGGPDSLPLDEALALLGGW